MSTKDSKTTQPCTLKSVSNWASSSLKNKVKYHLQMSVKAWHNVLYMARRHSQA